MFNTCASRPSPQKRPPSSHTLSSLRRSLSLHFGSFLLRSAILRVAANWAYEHLGPKVATGLNLLFADSQIVQEFHWRCHFGGRTFFLPVFPELHRSWHNARLWRWGGNRSIRRFYEFYLRSHPEGIFFDVGANDGIHTYPFAVSGYRCVCFEPQESCAAYVRRVCQLNGFEAVSVEHCAVSSIDQEAFDFFIGESSWYSSFVCDHVARWGDEPHRTTVRSVALDSYCRAHNLRPTLIKIDVEEAEWEVLDGARNTFHEWHPDALVEVIADPDQRGRIWAFFEPLGYACYSLQGDPRRPLAEVRTKAEFLRGDGKSPLGDYIFVSLSRFMDDIEELLEGPAPGLVQETSCI